MNRLLISGLSSLVTLPLYAFPCVFTLVKDSCWKDYELAVDVKEVRTNKALFSMTLPKGVMWLRHDFVCQPGDEIIYSATFKPTIWAGNENKSYIAYQFWSLPEAVKPDESAWEIPVCFPSAFSEVPLPPTAGSNCACDFKAVPALKPATKK